MAKISACVIVKNEEANLPHWLDCVKLLADEIIVVDTGSTDRSAQIAREAGARVLDFAWIDDFSAAKNFALEHAHGDWILFLDADESFLPADAPKILDAIRRHHPNRAVAGFVCRMVNVDTDRHDMVLDVIYQIRIFRNTPYLRFRGAIHEALHSTAKNKRRMQFLPEIKFIHTGYSSKLIRQKLKRNLAVLQDKQKESGVKEIDDFYFADIYFGLGEYEKAEAYAQKAVDADVRPIGSEVRPVGLLVQTMLQLGRPPEKLREVVDAGLSRFPQSAVLRIMSGLVFQKMRSYIRAEEECKRGIEMYEELVRGGNEALLGADNAHRLLPHAYFTLGQAAHLRGDDRLAAAYWQEGLAADRYHTENLTALAKLLSPLSAIDVIELLLRIYDKTLDARFLAEALAGTPLKETALYFDRLAGGVLSDWQRYLMAGRATAAAAAITDEADSLYRLGVVIERRMGIAGKGTMKVLLPEAYRNAAEGNALEKEEKAIARRIDTLEKELRRG